METTKLNDDAMNGTNVSAGELSHQQTTTTNESNAISVTAIPTTAADSTRLKETEEAQMQQIRPSRSDYSRQQWKIPKQQWWWATVQKARPIFKC